MDSDIEVQVVRRVYAVRLICTYWLPENSLDDQSASDFWLKCFGILLDLAIVGASCGFMLWSGTFLDSPYLYLQRFS